MNSMSESYPNLVRHGVLVAIDLLLINERNEVLLGRRKNAPARGYFFVPGGSVRKGESLPSALRRIAKQETGLDLRPDQLTFHGVYDHLYEDSFFDASVPTQYVVIACRCEVHSEMPITADSQHESLFFLPIEALLASPEVHPNTKNYFRERPENLFLSAALPDAVKPASSR